MHFEQQSSGSSDEEDQMKMQSAAAQQKFGNMQMKQPAPQIDPSKQKFDSADHFKNA